MRFSWKILAATEKKVGEVREIELQCFAEGNIKSGTVKDIEREITKKNMEKFKN